MKAAVIYDKGDMPQYADVAEPVATNGDEVLATVKAVALKHFDKSSATGSHYSSTKPGKHGLVIGSDGVCMLADGTRVYAIGVSGMMAEKAVLAKDRMVKIPQALDDATAAALPNAVIGSAMALKFRARIKAGDVVLVNGASGFTGRVAVQMARHYGAKKVIATARNQHALTELLALGADEVILLSQNDENFKLKVHALHQETPVDIVIDYLWGSSAEILLECFKGNGAFTHCTRYVSVGAITGDVVKLSSEILRSTDLCITGSGLGSWTKEQVKQLFTDILPGAFALAANKQLVVETLTVRLKDIATLWDTDVPNGKRLVIAI